MVPLQNSKVVYAVHATTVATNATSSSRIDRMGFDYAAIDVVIPVATATNSSATFGTLKLMEGDSTASSSASNVTGFVGGTDFTVPVQNDTSNPLIARLLVDCRARKRYLFPIVQAPASHSTITVRAELGRAEQAPATDANRGSNVTTVIG
jgi:hypothetical protein